MHGEIFLKKNASWSYLLWGFRIASSTAVSSRPYARHRLSASIPSLRRSSKHRSFSSTARIPVRTWGSSNHFGFVVEGLVTQTSARRLASSRSGPSSVGKGGGSGKFHWGRYCCCNSSLYLLNLCMAVNNAGVRLLIALRACWWSFVPLSNKHLVLSVEDCSALADVTHLMADHDLPQPGLIYPIRRMFLLLVCVY